MIVRPTKTSLVEANCDKMFGGIKGCYEEFFVAKMKGLDKH